MYCFFIQKITISTSFDFIGTYTAIREHEFIEYDMDDGRHVKIEFFKTPEGIHVVETFDPEQTNPEEMQRSGWQNILDNFKKHTENYQIEEGVGFVTIQ